MKNKIIKEKLVTKIEEAMKKKIENASQEELSEANAWIEGYECCEEKFSNKLEQLKITKEDFMILVKIVRDWDKQHQDYYESKLRVEDFLKKKIEELKGEK